MATPAFDDILTRLLGVLVSLTLLTPLFFWPTFYLPFSSPTLLGFLFLVELTLPISFLLAIRKQNPLAPVRHPIILALSVFTLVLLFTSFTGVDPLNSLLGTLQRPVSVILSLHGLLFSFYVFELINRDVRWKERLSLLVIGVGTFTAVYALGEGWVWPAFVSYEGRVGSFLGNPTFLASFLLIPMFLSLAYAFERTHTQRAVFIAAGVAMLGAILRTGTRGAILGLVTALVLGLGVWMFNQRATKAGTSKTALWIAGSALVVVVLFLATLSTSVWQRLLSTSDENIHTRLVYWDMAVEGWLDAPILGVGPGNFYAVADRLFTSDLYTYTTSWPDKPHNSFLEHLVTTGMVGTAAWLIFLALLYKEVWRRRQHPPALILVCGLTAYLVQGLFFFDGISDVILFAFLVGWIIPTSVPMISSKRIGISILAGWAGLLLAALGIITFVLPLWSEAAHVGQSEVPSTRIVIDDLLVSRTASSLAQKASENRQNELLSQAIALYDFSLARHPARQAAWNDQAWLYYLKAVIQSLPVEPSGIAAAQRAMELAPGRREATYILELMMEHNETLFSP